MILVDQNRQMAWLLAPSDLPLRAPCVCRSVQCEALMRPPVFNMTFLCPPFIEPLKALNHRKHWIPDQGFNLPGLTPDFSSPPWPPFSDSVYTAVGADWQVYIICLYTLGSDILDPSETVYSKNWYLICFVWFFLRSRDLELGSMVFLLILVG